MKFQLSANIYLDKSFVIEAYEAITQKPIPVKTTKTENVSTSLSAGFISGGASTTETKEFPFSTGKMYEKIESELLNFPSVKLGNVKSDQLPEYFWTTGIFSASGSQTIRGDKVLNSEYFFRLLAHIGKPKGFILVTNDAYLATGYDHVQKHLGGSCQGFGIEVKGLFKLLAIDPIDSPICAPLVMIKTRNV